MTNILGLGKIGLYYLMGRRVTPADFGTEYDRVAPTYSAWLSRMSRHTDLILNTNYLPDVDTPLRIIDLACGTGYVTRELLHRIGPDRKLNITCVDVSAGMLEQARISIDDCRVEFVHADG